MLTPKSSCERVRDLNYTSGFFFVGQTEAAILIVDSYGIRQCPGKSENATVESVNYLAGNS